MQRWQQERQDPGHPRNRFPCEPFTPQTPTGFKILLERERERPFLQSPCRTCHTFANRVPGLGGDIPAPQRPQPDCSPPGLVQTSTDRALTCEMGLKTRDSAAAVQKTTLTRQQVWRTPEAGHTQPQAARAKPSHSPDLI